MAVPRVTAREQRRQLAHGDDGAAHHPLVATQALLDGDVERLPGPAAERPASGRLPGFARATMLHVAEALFSVAGQTPPRARMRWLDAELDDFMARSSAIGRLQFTLAALLVSVLAPLWLWRPPGLGRLSIVQRVRALDRFEQSPAAPLLIALRAILCLLYYEHPDAAREVGAGVDRPAVQTPQ